GRIVHYQHARALRGLHVLRLDRMPAQQALDEADATDACQSVHAFSPGREWCARGALVDTSRMLAQSDAAMCDAVLSLNLSAQVLDLPQLPARLLVGSMCRMIECRAGQAALFAQRLAGLTTGLGFPVQQLRLAGRSAPQRQRKHIQF